MTLVVDGLKSEYRSIIVILGHGEGAVKKWGRLSLLKRAVCRPLARGPRHHQSKRYSPRVPSIVYVDVGRSFCQEVVTTFSLSAL